MCFFLVFAVIMSVTYAHKIKRDYKNKHQLHSSEQGEQTSSMNLNLSQQTPEKETEQFKVDGLSFV